MRSNPTFLIEDLQYDRYICWDMMRETKTISSHAPISYPQDILTHGSNGLSSKTLSFQLLLETVKYTKDDNRRVE